MVANRIVLIPLPLTLPFISYSIFSIPSPFIIPKAWRAMRNAEIVTGTAMTGVTNEAGTVPGFGEAGRERLTLYIHLDGDTSVIQWRVIRVLHPKLDGHAQLEPLALQGLNSGHRHVERIARLE